MVMENEQAQAGAQPVRNDLEPISALQEVVDRYFTHHTLSSEQKEKSDRVRHVAKQLAHAVLESCPPGRSREEALAHVRAAMMFANSAIAGGE